MSSVALYCVVKKHRTYDLQSVDSNKNQIYEQMCSAISTKDLQKVRHLLKSMSATYALLNVPIFTCDIACCFTNCIALNLCHFAVFNDSREILTELLKHGGDLSKKTFEVTLSEIERSFIEKDSLVDLIVRHFTEPVKYLKDLFDGYIETSDRGSAYEFKFDFSILHPSAKMESQTPKSERQMCVLNGIVNSSSDIYSEECGLLQHPLIEVYLTCKWSHYRRFFYILVAMHSLFVACLSTIALVIVGNFKTFSHFQNSTAESELYTIDATLTTLQTLNYLLFLFGSLLLSHALIQAFFIPLRKLFYEFEIILNLFTSVCALLNCAYGIVQPLQWQLRHHFNLIYTLNSLIILPAWIDLMLIIGRIPSLGCYSLMFTTVMKNFLKVMVSFIFLIVGFALSFSLMFPMSDFFNNPFGAILRTIVMMVGELDYTGTFSKSNEPFNSATEFVFILFLISCCIILMNLTQGIAVNDIKLLHEISQIIRLEKETRFLYEFESIFTQRIMTANPVLRKIKNRLYDSGAIKNEILITKDNRQRISKTLMAKLLQLYRPTKSILSRNLSYPQFQFKCLPSRSDVLQLSHK